MNVRRCLVGDNVRQADEFSKWRLCILYPRKITPKCCFLFKFHPSRDTTNNAILLRNPFFTGSEVLWLNCYAFDKKSAYPFIYGLYPSISDIYWDPDPAPVSVTQTM